MVILFSLVSCSSKPEDAIVGKWSEIGGTETLELFKEGTIVSANESKNMTGKYTFIDKDRVKFEFDMAWAGTFKTVYAVAISGNELTLTDSDGDPTKYKRE